MNTSDRFSFRNLTLFFPSIFRSPLCDMQFAQSCCQCVLKLIATVNDGRATEWLARIVAVRKINGSERTLEPYIVGLLVHCPPSSKWPHDDNSEVSTVVRNGTFHPTALSERSSISLLSNRNPLPPLPHRMKSFMELTYKSVSEQRPAQLDR